MGPKKPIWKLVQAFTGGGLLLEGAKVMSKHQQMVKEHDLNVQKFKSEEKFAYAEDRRKDKKHVAEMRVLNSEHEDRHPVQVLPKTKTFHFTKKAKKDIALEEGSSDADL